MDEDYEHAGFYRRLGNEIRLARQGHHVTQAQLANELGLTRPTIANMEAGNQRMSTHTLAFIAAALKVPIDELLPELHPTETALSIEKFDLTGFDANTIAFIERCLRKANQA